MYLILAIFLSSSGPAFVRVEVIKSIEEGHEMGAFFSGTASDFAVYRGTHGGVPHEASQALEACLAACEDQPIAFSVEYPFVRLGGGMPSYDTVGEGSL